MYKMTSMLSCFLTKMIFGYCIMKKSVIDLIYGNVTNHIKSQGNVTNGNVTKSN